MSAASASADAEGAGTADETPGAWHAVAVAAGVVVILEGQDVTHVVLLQEVRMFGSAGEDAGSAEAEGPAVGARSTGRLFRDRVEGLQVEDVHGSPPHEADGLPVGVRIQQNHQLVVL